VHPIERVEVSIGRRSSRIGPERVVRDSFVHELRPRCEHEILLRLIRRVEVRAGLRIEETVHRQRSIGRRGQHAEALAFVEELRPGRTHVVALGDARRVEVRLRLRVVEPVDGHESQTRRQCVFPHSGWRRRDERRALAGVFRGHYLEIGRSETDRLGN